MKRLPFLALALSAILFAFAVQPAAATPDFPADGDIFWYELRVDILQVNATGPDNSYQIEIDMKFEFINHTGNDYYQNISMFWYEPEFMFPPNTTAPYETSFALLHHYDQDGQIRRMYPINPSDWTDIAPFYFYDFLLIPKGTLPGDTLTFGAYNYSMYSHFTFELPIGLGEPVTVPGYVLGTVGMAFNYQQEYLGTVDTGVYYEALQYNMNFSWEWSMGFLTSVQYDIYQDLNPNYMYNYDNTTEMYASGTFMLANFTTTDIPTPLITTTPTGILPPGIPGFPIEAIVAGLLVALIPLILIRKRKR